ncbi:L,D-transpeptidase, partial [Mesorhizobium sp. M3A.F.Ca.ET.174.01.1.1]
CTTTSDQGPAPIQTAPPQAPVEPPLGDYETMYGAISDNGFDLPAIPVHKIDHRFLRQIVPDPTGQRPGTIVVDTTNHFLYLVREGGQAIRYGVGLG